MGAAYTGAVRLRKNEKRMKKEIRFNGTRGVYQQFPKSGFIYPARYSIETMRKFHFWKRVFLLLDKLAMIYVWSSIVLTISFFVLLGFLSIFSDYITFGSKEVIDFSWELVGFCFVLAALLFGVDEKNLLISQRRFIPIVASLFILTGILIILSYGLFNPELAKHSINWKYAGQFSFITALFALSFGIAVMFIESVRRIFTRQSVK